MKTKPFATVVVGAFEVNCYLVPSPDKKTLYIIDPGGDAQEIITASSAFSPEKTVGLSKKRKGRIPFLQDPTGIFSSSALQRNNGRDVCRNPLIPEDRSQWHLL